LLKQFLDIRMDQLTLAQGSFEPHRKATRREQFLQEMDQVVPWSPLCRLISPYYPKAGNGRPPLELERMLRIYFMQQWFNLSDPGAEEALYDSHAMQHFIGLDLGKESAPDETTICKFRHLLERHDLGKKLFASVGKHLQEKGIKIANGTIVDATIINAPPSTKNEEKARDPEMHQTRKGNQWYFGMKAHIGVDSKSKVIHSVVVTAANVHDSQVLGDLLHGEETRVWGDSAYTGQGAVLKEKAPAALDFIHDKARKNHPLTDEQKASNRYKSRVRAKVEHAFGVMKNIFGFRKVRYRGLEKNSNAVFVLSALTNLFMMRRQLLRG
jgi:IS5 family transposase